MAKKWTKKEKTSQESETAKQNWREQAAQGTEEPAQGRNTCERPNGDAATRKRGGLSPPLCFSENTDCTYATEKGPKTASPIFNVQDAPDAAFSDTRMPYCFGFVSSTAPEKAPTAVELKVIDLPVSDSLNVSV